MIKYIVYEESDEFLTYEMDRLVNYYDQHSDLPEFHKVAIIIEGLKYDKPIFKDTLILEPGDNELVPHRELYFSIEHKGKDFTIVLRHLLPGNDDILEGTVFIVVGFFSLISLMLFLMVNNISGRVWQPFYRTLSAITKYQITEPLPVFQKSSIDEFNSLNDTIHGFLRKISLDYKRTKEFNENASHELQTHLAIIRANAEKLLNISQQNDINPKQIQAILNATIKLSNIQKSLLLLSKIGNLEYKNNINLNMSDVVNQSLALFQEAIEFRNISIKKSVENSFQLMDAGLAEIMINNLLKNAVKYNIQDGYISIILLQSSLIIENSGLAFGGKSDTLLERFSIGENGNLGIGLSIVKQICELYKFRITYHISNASIHTLSIHFKPE
jgi:signal transduction histidine kinase